MTPGATTTIAWSCGRPACSRDAAAAEDVVQEAFRRLHGTPLDEIDDVRRLARRRRAPAVPEPPSRPRTCGTKRRSSKASIVAGSPTPTPPTASRSTTRSRLALAVVLDRLTPAERTAFVLHDVFGFPFDAIAAIVGRTPAAVRQLASSGASRDPAPTRLPTAGSPTSIRRDTRRRRRAVHRGVRRRRHRRAHGGARSRRRRACRAARLRTVADATGRPAVAQRLIGLFGPDSGSHLVPVTVEGEAGVVAYVRGRLAALVRLQTDNGVIRHMRAWVLPPTS